MTEDGIRERAIRDIMTGGTPRSVAIQFPAWFVDNHTGIIRLWEVVNRKTWRSNE